MKRGLDHAIDYRTNDWADVLNQLTKGKGVELIIDPFGGKSWKKSFKALRRTGRLGMFGISTTTESGSAKMGLVKIMVQTPWFHPFKLMGANKSVFGVDLGKMWGEGEKVKVWMLKILQGVEEGWIRPHVDNTFSFEEAGKAHEYIENRKNIGKVVLVP
jgi:NADPH:quinone reductase-like Zn-dependent oxidoreductase